MAASAVGLVLAFSAPVALADAPPSGAPAGQAASTDQTTTTETQTQGPGTPGDTGSATGASNETPSTTDVLDGLKDAAATAGTTDSSSSQDDPAVDDSGDDDPATDPVPPSSTGQSSTADASAGQTGASNGNVATRVGQGGDNGAVGQGNDASASASSSSAGNVPGSGDAPSSTADAGATQTSPGNTNIEVRVDSPGNTGAVGQSNNANAGAAAAGNGNADGTGTGGVANADAAQTDPSNVNVIIRVGSRGDNGAVNQQNNVGANAGASLPGQTTGAGITTPDPSTADQSVETTSEAGVQNSGDLGQDVNQHVGSGESPAPGSPTSGTPASLPQTSTGTAHATQTGASNTNVSVRIGSPGVDAPVTQSNTATAVGTTPDLGIVTVTGGSNTNVSIALPGATFAPPAGSDPWTWNWVWTGDWAPPANATADELASTATDAWNWVWQNEPTPATTAATTTGSSTSSTGTPDTWSWTWTWTTAAGTTTSLVWQRACACNWNWTWTWDWSTGTPTSTTQADAPADPAPQVPDDSAVDVGPVAQENTVSATADAEALLTVSQSADGTQEHGPDAPSQTASTSQGLVAIQLADATATAEQTNPVNLNVVWGTATAGVAQTNDVAAHAWALISLDARQAIEQHQTGTGSTEQQATADQSIASTQIATAVADAKQDAPSNVAIVWAPQPNGASIGRIEQRNSAVATADAEMTYSALQSIWQLQTAGAAQGQAVDAEQLLANEQHALATTVVTQLRTRNRYEAIVMARSVATAPRFSQLNYAHAATGAYDDIVGSQTIAQSQDGEGDVEISVASQDGVTVQTASAWTSSSQTDLLNDEHWVGPTPPPPPDDTATPSDGDAAPDAAVASAASAAGPGPAISPDTVAMKPIVEVLAAIVQQTSKQPHVRQQVVVSQQHAGAAAGAGAQRGSGFTTSALPKLGSPVPSAAARAGSAEPNAAGSAPQKAGGRRGQGGPTRPSHGTDAILGVGPGGSAPPSGGSGPVGFPARAYKFAAPASSGSQLPASDLGRPMYFMSPLERPG